MRTLSVNTCSFFQTFLSVSHFAVNTLKTELSFIQFDNTNIHIQQSREFIIVSLLAAQVSSVWLPQAPALQRVFSLSFSVSLFCPLLGSLGVAAL